MANLGFDDVRFTKPVYAGDTLYAETTILDKRGSNSRPDHGIVAVETRGINQRGEIVMTLKRSILVPRRAQTE
jgi:itaconyl-CoA hydratase